MASADGMVTVPPETAPEPATRAQSKEEYAAREYTRYHPATPEQVEKMAQVRDAAEHLILAIARNCPSNADRSAAIRKVRECLMTANAAIVLPPISL